MDFSIVAEIFEKMENTTKRIELTNILVELLKKTPKKIIPNAVYLLQGIIRPNFEGVELGIAEKLAIRAISKSAGLPIKKIEDDYRSEEHTSELQSRRNLVCRLLLEKKNTIIDKCNH